MEGEKGFPKPEEIPETSGKDQEGKPPLKKSFFRSRIIKGGNVERYPYPPKPKQSEGKLEMEVDREKGMISFRRKDKD